MQQARRLESAFFQEKPLPRSDITKQATHQTTLSFRQRCRLAQASHAILISSNRSIRTKEYAAHKWHKPGMLQQPKTRDRKAPLHGSSDSTDFEVMITCERAWHRAAWGEAQHESSNSGATDFQTKHPGRFIVIKLSMASSKLCFCLIKNLPL